MKIVIAGTSVGGSNYTNRIIKALKSNPLGTPIEIIIGKGDCQNLVYDVVCDSCDDIEFVISKFAAKKCHIQYTILKEL